VSPRARPVGVRRAREEERCGARRAGRSARRAPPRDEEGSNKMTSGSTARFREILAAWALLFGLCQCENSDRVVTSAVVGEPARPAAMAAISSDGGEARICEIMCEHSRALTCAAASECASSCAALLEERACHAPLLSALHCMVAEPVSHWDCGEDGLASIQSGFCDAEQRAFVGCVQQG
jgi:hypothetical protein